MFYNHIDNLAKLDWNIISKQYWYNTEDDYDRMRRKQAEFLVKRHVPTNIPIYVDTERKYFFP